VPCCQALLGSRDIFETEPHRGGAPGWPTDPAKGPCRVDRSAGQTMPDQNGRRTWAGPHGLRRRRPCRACRDALKRRAALRRGRWRMHPSLPLALSSVCWRPSPLSGHCAAMPCRAVDQAGIHGHALAADQTLLGAGGNCHLEQVAWQLTLSEPALSADCFAIACR